MLLPQLLQALGLLPEVQAALLQVLLLLQALQAPVVEQAFIQLIMHFGLQHLLAAPSRWIQHLLAPLNVCFHQVGL